MAVKIDELRIHDTRTSRDYAITVENNTIKASDLAAIKNNAQSYNAAKHGTGLRIYDPGYHNVAVAKSNITYTNGKGGQAILEYRGYSIEELVDRFEFEEVAFLLIWERLPSPQETAAWKRQLAVACQNVPATVVKVVQAFPRSTPFYVMLMASLSAFLGDSPDSIPAVSGRNLYHGDIEAADDAIVRCLAAYAVSLALVHCHRSGLLFTPAQTHRGFLENVLLMMGLCDLRSETPNHVAVNAISKLWIMGCDHELTNSTSAFLQCASSLTDPLSCTISALMSGYGILHFGAAESAYKVTKKIATKENVRPFLAHAKATGARIMGVGHRTYKTRDPRVRLVKDVLKTLEQAGFKDPLVEVPLEMERQIQSDESFARRGLCVNVDLLWLFAYTAVGVPPEAILPMFFGSRMIGFLAHWRESLGQPVRIWRPLQLFTGSTALERSLQEQAAREGKHSTQDRTFKISSKL